MASSKRILAVDDEPGILKLLQARLSYGGYEITTAQTAAEGLEKAKAVKPDVILLDIMLPDGDGTDVCRQLKRDPVTSAIPVIMLTARGHGADEAISLEVGADDYIGKPFDPRVLEARIKKQLEKASALPQTSQAEKVPERLEDGGLVLDTRQQKVFIDGKDTEFTHLEYRILLTLVKNTGRVYERQELIRESWREKVTVSERSVDVHMNNIRKKLGPYGKRLKTVYGSGYRYSS